MLSGGGDGGNMEEIPEGGHFSGLKAVMVSYLPADLHEECLTPVVAMQVTLLKAW